MLADCRNDTLATNRSRLLRRGVHVFFSSTLFSMGRRVQCKILFLPDFGSFGVRQRTGFDGLHCPSVVAGHSRCKSIRPSVVANHMGLFFAPDWIAVA
jgi:hypothetical protein